jgi:YidC/Oxa1 family membrane protein insertase
MDTQRLILFVVFSFSLLLLWEAWQKESKPPVPAAAATSQTAVPTPSALGEAPQAKGASVPAAAAAAESGPREIVRVQTDLVRAEIDTRGGDIVFLELLQQKDAGDAGKNIVLFGPEHRYAMQSGLIGAGLPNHKTQFRARAKEFALAAGEDKVEVRLEASGPPGAAIASTWLRRSPTEVARRSRPTLISS